MSVADIIFPRVCPVCSRIVRPDFSLKSDTKSIPAGLDMEKLICPHCYSRLSFVREPVCLKCGAPVTASEKEYCENCKKHHRDFKRCVAMLNYSDEISSKIMWDLKYKGKREYSEFLALEMARRFARFIVNAGCQVIIPVPVHPSRRRKRGYNQAELIAKKLGNLLEIKTDTKTLVRVKKTLPQKKLDAKMRAENLKTAFRACETASSYRTVLLVDDIYTTGATLQACTRALLDAGAGEVYAAVCCIGSSSI